MVKIFVMIPDDKLSYFMIYRKKIKEFLEDSRDDKPDHFILDRCNGFMRRLLYQEVPKVFGDAAQLETCDDSSFVRLFFISCDSVNYFVFIEVHLLIKYVSQAMKVMRGGGEELRKQREEEKIKKEWKEFEETVGLSQLIKIISESVSSYSVKLY